MNNKGSLRQISATELEQWLILSKNDYANDLTENHGYSEERAQHEAAESIQSSLPLGINTPHQHFRIYQRDQQAIGYLWFSRENDAAFLMDLILLPEYQGQGIGKEIMRAFIDELKDLDVQEIELRVAPNNLRAQKLYEQFGFRVTGFDMHLDLNRK
ncbi:N-acetyltransferase [Pantoea sp. SOD02]|uniref:GNAT family N-acetyltransferase n=1 Tax=Pantoea sp. SOD02 TaxID=2970818 RepID=UPI0021584115|nr:GNAT family N-acetyltransferase [Pantoea sp. SOD02]UVC31438.1 GNAT family N-acetyltransferase [Pantoea sp. SOD02]